MKQCCTTFFGGEQDLVTIRRLRSISPAQADVVAQAVAALPAPWRVERHDDYDGYLSVIVSLDKEDASTFALSGKADRIELCEVRDDELHPRGCFGTIADATNALLGLLRATSP